MLHITHTTTTSTSTVKLEIIDLKYNILIFSFRFITFQLFNNI